MDTYTYQGRQFSVPHDFVMKLCEDWQKEREEAKYPECTIEELYDDIADDYVYEEALRAGLVTDHE